MDKIFHNVRDILGWATDQRIIDITQHDTDEYAEDKEHYVMLMLENGGYIKFPISHLGFSCEQPDDPGAQAWGS